MAGDDEVGKNIKAIREMAGMSQAQVAEDMAYDGWSGFYPQTILKIEKGVRSLKLVEAVALAGVLRCQVRDLFQPPVTLENDLKVTHGARDVMAKYDKLRSAVTSFLYARISLEVALELSPLSDFAASYAAPFSSWTVESAVKAAEEKFKRETEF